MFRSRVTNHPGSPETEGSLGHETYRFKTGKILGKQGQRGHG